MELKVGEEYYCSPFYSASRFFSVKIIDHDYDWLYLMLWRYACLWEESVSGRVDHILLFLTLRGKVIPKGFSSLLVQDPKNTNE